MLCGHNLISFVKTLISRFSLSKLLILQNPLFSVGMGRDKPMKHKYKTGKVIKLKKPLSCAACFFLSLQSCSRKFSCHLQKFVVKMFRVQGCNNIKVSRNPYLCNIEKSTITFENKINVCIFRKHLERRNRKLVFHRQLSFRPTQFPPAFIGQYT